MALLATWLWLILCIAWLLVNGIRMLVHRELRRRWAGLLLPPLALTAGIWIGLLYAVFARFYLGGRDIGMPFWADSAFGWIIGWAPPIVAFVVWDRTHPRPARPTSATGGDPTDNPRN